MIHSATKKKLLVELEKNGNVSVACMKVGINRATFYRWREDSKEFMKKSNKVLRYGRENNCDIGEHSLMLKVKAQDLGAIKYLLSHNSPRYKNKQSSNVVIVHKKDLPVAAPIKTFEDLFDDAVASNHKEASQLHAELTRYGAEIPNKPDGTPISMDELSDYEAYIRNWQKTNGKEGKIVIG